MLNLMCPIDSELIPKVHQHPLHHIGFWIDDLFECVQWLEKHGVVMAPGGIRRGSLGMDIAFVHPRSTGGVLLELLQHPSRNS